MAQGRNHERPFPLLAALAISVLLHFVLALVTGWLPLLRPTPAAEVPEDTVLRFTFNQPAAETDDSSSLAGEVPIETPRPQPTVEPAVPGAEPAPAVEQLDPADALPPQDVPREATEGPGAASTAEFPEETDATLSNIPRPDVTAGAKETAEAARQFDLSRAVDDFGRALDRARSANPSAEPPGSGPPRNVYVPDPGDFPTTGYGMGNLVFETKDFDWSDYARAIYIQIWRAWHNRLLRTVNDFEKWSSVNRQVFLDHQNQIRFVIERSGEVTGIMIEAPSGCVPLDASATQALEEVILQALPDAFPKEREVVHARFIATGEIRSMRRHLNYLKDIGAF